MECCLRALSRLGGGFSQALSCAGVRHRPPVIYRRWLTCVPVVRRIRLGEVKAWLPAKDLRYEAFTRLHIEGYVWTVFGSAIDQAVEGFEILDVA